MEGSNCTIFKALFQHLLGGTEEEHKISQLGQVGLQPEIRTQDLPKYEAEVITTTPYGMISSPHLNI
jgi:uncharacterized protein affecting Mg2+/Co2+ transport